MKRFDVQGIAINALAKQSFQFIADPDNLPQWANAFASINGDSALMVTPAGEVEVSLAIESCEKAGTVDWYMTFPDGSLATAFSRIISDEKGSCICTFTLTPPPVPLEELEGAIDAQREILTQELIKLKAILESIG